MWNFDAFCTTDLQNTCVLNATRRGALNVVFTTATASAPSVMVLSLKYGLAERSAITSARDARSTTKMNTGWRLHNEQNHFQLLLRCPHDTSC